MEANLEINKERLDWINSFIPKGYTSIDCEEDLEDMYAVNKQGDVFSVRKRGILKPSDRLGYLSVYLTRFHGGGRSHFIHRIVAKQFIPNPRNCSDVNHKDGNKANNYVDNLEWCTHRENVQHSYDNLGRIASGAAKKPVLCLNNGKEYKSAVEAANDLGLFTSNISMCCNGKARSTKGYRFKFL